MVLNYYREGIYLNTNIAGHSSAPKPAQARKQKSNEKIMSLHYK